MKIAKERGNEEMVRGRESCKTAKWHQWGGNLMGFPKKGKVNKTEKKSLLLNRWKNSCFQKCIFIDIWWKCE